MNLPLDQQRRDYSKFELDESHLAANPLVQLEEWLAQAHEHSADSNAMTLATADESGQTSARIVLLKAIDITGQGGLTWFTNYESRKAKELAHNNKAALLFFWGDLERQVRIEGNVEKVTRLESISYFESRPLASRISAIASQQSQLLTSKDVLVQKVEQIAAQLKQADSDQNSAANQLPCPEHWGGYRLIPHYFEFWQGRRSRLHDLLVYRQINNTWVINRIQP